MLDVAGGRGRLQWELVMGHRLRCTVVDPLAVRLSAEKTKELFRLAARGRGASFGDSQVEDDGDDGDDGDNAGEAHAAADPAQPTAAAAAGATPVRLDEQVCEGRGAQARRARSLLWGSGHRLARGPPRGSDPHAGARAKPR